MPITGSIHAHPRTPGGFVAATILALGLVAGPPAETVAHDANPVQSRYVRQAPILDGDLSEWPDSAFIEVVPCTGTFDAESDSTADPADLSFRFSVANDDSCLYVAVQVIDDVMVIDNNVDTADIEASAWMDDAVEIFLDGDHSHAPDGRDAEGVEYRTGGEFAVVANGAVTSSYSGFPRTHGDPRYWTAATSYVASPAPAYAAPHDSAGAGFFVEVRISLDLAPAARRPGTRIGFTVSAHDDDDGGERDAALYWRGRSPHCWQNEGAWGDIVLAPSPESRD